VPDLDARNQPAKARPARWTPGRRWRVLLLVAVALLTAGLALRIPVVGTAFANLVFGRLAPLPGAAVRVGVARGDWLTHLELLEVRLVRGDRVIASVDTLHTRYRLWPLLLGRLEIALVEAGGARVSPGAFESVPGRGHDERPPSWTDLLSGRFYRGPAIRIDHLAVRGATLDVADDSTRAGATPVRLATGSLHLVAHDIALGGRFAFGVDSLALGLHMTQPSRHVVLTARGSLGNGRLEVPSLSLHSASSDVHVTARVAAAVTDSVPETRLELRASPLSLADLSPLFGRTEGSAEFLDGTLVGEGVVEGARLDRLTGSLDVRLGTGHVAGLAVRDARLRLAIEQGAADLEAAGAMEEALVEIRGHGRPFDGVPAYELSLDAESLPAALPGWPWWRDVARRAPLALELRVRGHGYSGGAFEIGARAHGDIGRLEARGSLDLAHGLAWRLDSLAIEDFDAARFAGAAVSSRITALVRAGGESTARRPSRAWARLDLAESSLGTIALRSTRAFVRLVGDRGGASLDLVSDAGSLAVDTLRWGATGAARFQATTIRIRGLDLARLTGHHGLASDLGADLQLEGSGLASLFAPRRGGATSRRPGRLRFQGHGRLEPSRFRGRALRQGDLVVGFEGGEARLACEVDSDAGSFSFDLRGRPFDDTPVARLVRGRFERVDVAAWSGAAMARSDLNGSLLGEASLEPGAVGGEAGATWRAELRLDPSRAGSVALLGGDVRATSEQGRTNLGGALDTRGGAIRLAADLTGSDAATWLQGRVDVPFSLLAEAVGRDTLHSEGTLTAVFEARGPLGEPEAVSASCQVSGAGALGFARVDSLRLSLGVVRGLLDVDTLALRSNVATAHAGGRVALVESPAADATGPVPMLRGEFVVLDAAPLAPLLGADSVSLGAGSLTAVLAGPARERSLTVNADLDALLWDGMSAGSLRGEAHADLDSHWRPTRGSVRATALRMSAVGATFPSARLRVDGDSKRVEFSADATAGLQDSMRVAGSLAADSTGWDVAIRRIDVRADTAWWRLARTAQLHIGSGRFVVEPFEITGRRGRIAVRGALARRGSQTFQVELERVSLALLSPWRDLGTLGGDLSGSFDLTGPAERPSAHGALSAQFEWGGRPAGTLGADLRWEGERLDLSSRFVATNGDSLSVHAHAPFRWTLAPDEDAGPAPVGTPGESELRVAARDFALRELAPLLGVAGITPLAGTLTADVRLAGRGSTFSGSGRVDLWGARLDLPELGVRHEDVELHGAWAGDRFVVERLGARTGGGSLAVTGAVRMAGPTRIEPDLVLRAERAVFVNTRELRAVGTGELRLTGRFWAPILTGHMGFEGCRYQVRPDAFVGVGGRSDVQLSTADLEAVDEAFAYATMTAPDPLLAFYDASDLDLVLQLGRGNLVRRPTPPRLHLEVTGEMRLRKRPHREPELFGHLEPVPGRGFVEQFGRSFEFVGGQVQLNGPSSSHVLRIQTEYGRSGGGYLAGSDSRVVVHLDIEGGVEELRLILSSEPPLSETEIIAYIATGRTPTTRGAEAASLGSDVAQLGRDIGLSTVTGALEDVAQRSVGLDVLKVHYDPLQGAALVAGRYVAPQLYIGFSQPLQSADAASDRPGEPNRTRVEVEYQAFRWLLLNVQGETSRVRSFVRFSREY